MPKLRLSRRCTQQQDHTPVADLFAQTRSPAEDDDFLSNVDRDEDDEEDRAIARASQWTAFDASAQDLDNLNLDLNVDLLRDNQAGGPAALAASTSLPGYLRTPNKHSTARQKAREGLGALGVVPTVTPAPTAPLAFRAANVQPAGAAYARPEQQQEPSGLSSVNSTPGTSVPGTQAGEVGGRGSG